ncbi:hypothetical protein ACU5AY_02160 [Rhizobium sp. PAMB 3174]
MSGSSLARGLRPEILALLAAMANGTIGPFSRIAFEAGAGHAEIAFFKCFGAFVIAASICLPFARYRRGLIELRHKALPLCVFSATGIAGVYFLETWAYRSVSMVAHNLGQWHGSGARVDGDGTWREPVLDSHHPCRTCVRN